MIKITQKLVSSTKYNIKCPYKMTPEYITVHNTANDATAENEISYMNNNNNEVSYHFAVDDIQAVQGLPLDRNGWHCGDGGNGIGNRKSIGIEICYSKSGGDKFTKAENNAVELIAHLLKKYGWGIDRVKKHQDWSNKRCPHRTLDLGWDRFIKMIEEKLNDSSTTNSQVNVYYKVKTQKHGWLGEIKNYNPNDEVNGYAGWQDSPITGVAIKVDKGSIKYRVHVKGGKWLGWIKHYNINDYINGYAGNGKPIDAIQVYYYTPNDIRPYKKAKYKVNNYGWQTDTDTKNGLDGYAGAFGVTATKLQISIE